MLPDRKIIITLKDPGNPESLMDDVAISTEGEVDRYDLLESISALIKAYSDHGNYTPTRIAEVALKAVMLAEGAGEKSDEGD